jgi:hypothetical protein
MSNDLRDLLHELRAERSDARAAALIDEVMRMVEFEPRGPRECGQCGKTFAPAHSHARYCSTKCRVAAHRAKAAR